MPPTVRNHTHLPPTRRFRECSNPPVSGQQLRTGLPGSWFVEVGSDTCDVPKSPTGSHSHGPLLKMKSGDLIRVFSPSQPIKHSFSDAESQARIFLRPDTLDLRPCFF